MRAINLNANPVFVKNTSNVVGKRNIYTIAGSVKKQGVPYPCNIGIYDRVSGRLIKKVKTDDLGRYEAKELYKDSYFIVALDQSQEFNAVIQDNVVPK